MPDPEDRPRIRSSLDGSGGPKLSVVVVVYNIPREVPRTLLSLSASYQRNIAASDYEVIVVDNGSDPALDPEMVAGFGDNFRLIRVDPAPPSPAHAVNRGIAEARGDIVGVMIDGARIASPGLLHFALHGAHLYSKAIVATLGWYIGFDFQRFAMRGGYDAAREDALLASINWPEDGYRLFEISTMDESSVEGWFCPIAESNALFLKKECWDALQGMDERFDVPGGGLVNLDTFDRALALPDAQLVILLGEGTFHQLHGGIATNGAPERQAENWQQWAGQYAQIRDRAYQIPVPGKPPAYVGTLSRTALLHFTRAAIDPIQRRSEPPLGYAFKRDLWALTPPVLATDPAIAAVIELAHTEFRAGRYPAVASIARLIRSRAPDEPEPQRFLSLIANSLDQGCPLSAEYCLAIGKARELLGDKNSTVANHQSALIPDAPCGGSMSNTNRNLYLDLLIKILTNMIYGDPSTNPVNRGPFQPELRADGWDWPAVAHTMIGVHRLQNVRELVQRAIDEGIPGDFIETGVWRGGCCILMRGVLAANAVKDRKVYAADSFAGLPPPNEQLYPQDKGLNLHLHPELAVSLDEVKDNFSRYGLLDEQVVFVPGLFKDTLPSLQAGPFALIRLDGDLYESTYGALEALYPKLSPRGFVIIDDFKLIPPCQQAVMDYRTRMGITAAMQDDDWNSVWWQKE